MPVTQYEIDDIAVPPCESCGHVREPIRIFETDPGGFRRDDAMASTIVSFANKLGCEGTNHLEFIEERVSKTAFFQYLLEECEDDHVREMYEQFKSTGKIPEGYDC